MKISNTITHKSHTIIGYGIPNGYGILYYAIWSHYITLMQYPVWKTKLFSLRDLRDFGHDIAKYHQKTHNK